MIFVGDIAMPFEDCPNLPTISWSSNQKVVANLEGDIIDSPGNLFDEAIVFNSKAVLSYLDRLGVRAVSLANNHMFDVHDSSAPTINALAEYGISACGAGETLSEAQQPCLIEENGTPVVLMSFGWEPIECQVVSAQVPGVNPLTPANVINSVKQARKEYPRAKIVLVMHWNYELELYPQPMHRQLAFRAVDAGADAIIGTHSHCVQGLEIYRGSPIVHGLGNWMFAQGEYFSGTLTYPDCASVELAFEWTPEQEDMTCHWFVYDSQTHALSHQSSEWVTSSERVHELTPYAGMDHEQYVSFFREHRRKRKLLPVYPSCDQTVRNYLRDRWVALRGSIIRNLMQTGFKSAERSS